jgi:hypothetical protein
MREVDTDPAVTLRGIVFFVMIHAIIVVVFSCGQTARPVGL